MLAIPLLEDIGKFHVAFLHHSSANVFFIEAIRELELSCANGAAGIETGFINHAAIGINSVIFIFLFFFGFIHCGYSFIAV